MIRKFVKTLIISSIFLATTSQSSFALAFELILDNETLLNKDNNHSKTKLGLNLGNRISNHAAEEDNSFKNRISKHQKIIDYIGVFIGDYAGGGRFNLELDVNRNLSFEKTVLFYKRSF